MAINKAYDEVQLDVEFTQASTRANLVSKENISVSFGKISKYFADLHSQAFTGYTHPSHTAHSSGLYKITVDGLGHVTAATTVTGNDLPTHEHPYLPLAGGTLTGRVTTSKFLNYVVKGTGTTGADKGSGQNPRYVPAKWTFNTGQTVSDGDVIIIKIPVAGHDYGVYISIDNGTTYHPAVISGTSRLTSHYGNGNYAAFVFRSDGSAASMIPLAGNTDGTRVTVTGGVWQGIDYYDSGNTYDRTSQQTRIYAGGVGVFRYSICGLNSAQRMESFTTTGDASGSPTTTKTFNTSAKFSYPPVIMYNNANAVYSNGNAIGNNVLYEQFPSLDMRYSCNKTSSASTGFTQYKPVFIECTFDDNGFWSITSNGFVQTFTSGKYYILVGCMYNTSVYQLAMFAQHPVYYYDGTNLTMVPFTKAEKTKLAGISEGANKTEASSTNGKIKIDGTDTTVYTHPSHTSKTSGLYKITVDSTGHVSATAAVAKGDIPALDYVPNTKNGINAAINLLDTGSSTPTDADYYISQYVGGGTTTTTYHRRPMSALWSYVKDKADSVYSPIGHTHTLSIATDSGTNQLTLSANTKYKLTAGGSTFVFTTPTNPTVNNASLTLKGAGTTVTTFTANSSTNQSLDIVAGSNVTVTADATNAKISIASSHPTITKSADTTSTASPGHGGTFTTVDSVTRDGNGHVTKINTKTITLPADSNTDTLVSQTFATADNNRPLLMSYYKVGEAAGTAQVAYRNDALYFNPSGGILRSPRLYLQTTGMPITINLDTLQPAAGENANILAVRYKNTDGTATHAVFPIGILGNDATGSNATVNSGVRLGSTNGTTVVGAGESSVTFAEAQAKYNDENLYFVADGAVYMYTNCSNDSTTVTGPWRVGGFTTGTSAITSGRVMITDGTAGGFKASDYTIAKSVPSDAKFTDTTYSAGTGLSLSGTTFNHSNSVTAATSAVFKKITYDAQGHITGTANVTASDLPSHTHSNYLGAVKIGSYYGMADPDGTDTSWTRTSKLGIIPYATNTDITNGNVSSLGTSTWTFNNGYINNLYYKDLKTVTVVAGSTDDNGIDKMAGSFFFSGNNLFGGINDWVGIQAGYSADKWQIIGNGSGGVMFRQNDSGGTNTTSWSDFKALVIPDNITGSDGITVTNTTRTIGTGETALTYDSGVSITHSNSVTEETSFNKPFVKYDAQGHITASSYWSATATGTGGEAGWVKVATMKHVKTYDNTPIMLTVSQRGNSITYKIHIVFKNANNTNPDLDKFYLVSDESTNARAYIIKSATSTWDLFIRKIDNYEAIAITLTAGRYFDDHMEWTWTNVQTDESLITGGTEATKKVFYNSLAIRTANTVLAAPNGSDGQATFRKLVAADIPDLDYVPNTQAGVNAAINLLSTGSSTPALADYYVSQFASGGTTTTSYHRRPISALWNAFKGLITLETTGTGNAVTAVSIANDGDHNRKITVTKESTFVVSRKSIATDSSEDFASYAWHKFAEVTLTSTNYDYVATFIVSSGFIVSSTYAAKKLGILTMHVRTDSSRVYASGELEWLVAGSQINPNNFVMVYTNTANTSCKVELWYKQIHRYEGYTFNIIDEHTRTVKNIYTMTLNDTAGHGSSTYTAGTGTLISKLGKIKNAPGIYSVKGTQTASTSVWTGHIDVSELYDGLTIAYYLPYASTSTSVTLNLILSDGTTTGAIDCYYTNTSRITTHYGAGSTVILTYWSAGSISVSGTATTNDRWTRCDYNSNSSVTQNITSGNAKRPLLMSYYQTGTTTTSAQVVYRNDSIYANPSTGTIHATTFVGNITTEAFHNAIYALDTTTDTATFNGSETLITSLPSSSGTSTPSYRRTTLNNFIKNVISNLKEPVLYENTLTPSKTATITFNTNLGMPKYLKLFIVVCGSEGYTSGVTNIVDIDPSASDNGCFVSGGSPGQSGVSTFLTAVCIRHTVSSNNHTYNIIPGSSIGLQVGSDPSHITQSLWLTKIIAVY